MTESRFDPAQDPAAGSQMAGNSSGGGSAATRRRLELELQRIRSEASAARLDARAAEIELELRQLDQGHQGSGDSESEMPVSRPAPSSGPSSTLPPARRPLKSWDDVRKWMDRAGFPATIPRGIVRQRDLERSPDESSTFRVDAGAADPRAPRMRALGILDAEVTNTETQSELDPTEKRGDWDPLDQSPEIESNVPDEILRIDRGHDDDATTESIDLPTESELELTDDDETLKRRRSPMALAVSALVHVAVILMLALIGYQTHTPKDQVALTASTSETSMAEFETMSVETVEPVTEPVEETEPTEVDFEYDLSPMGEMAPPKMSAPTPPSFAKAMKTMSASSSSAKMLSDLKTDSKANIRFCGVDGGGNHFVYLLDSSGSMGEGFESARRELLQSIDALTPKQRFYVVFYDKEPDFMRITNPNVDEPFSVSATPANKAALRRWAMTVSQDRGWAPYEPTEFALKKLRPDVIFLLSDGEFPQKFEDMLKENNVVDNLFGDHKPVSIIHTIAYYSKEGESRMRRIAKQHGGQFRYVPKP